MWVSISGCIFIVCSTVLMGIYMSLKAKMRILELSEMQKILMFIKNEIMVYNSIFTDIIEKICRMESLRVRVLFQILFEEIGIKSQKSINELWKNSVEACSKELNLNAEDIEVIKYFGLVLERSDINGQINNINITIEKLQDLEKRATASYDKNGKLYRSAGALSGLAISILLF